MQLRKGSQINKNITNVPRGTFYAKKDLIKKYCSREMIAYYVKAYYNIY